MNENLTYKKAMDELKKIQEKLQTAPQDLDQMIEDVRKADHLIRFCREKLEGAKSIVRDILEEGFEEE